MEDEHILRPLHVNIKKHNGLLKKTEIKHENVHMRKFTDRNTSKDNKSKAGNTQHVWEKVGHINTYHACGVCLPFVGVVEAAPSSVAMVSAEVRGYMLRLIGKNNTCRSTTSTTYVLYHQGMVNNRVFKCNKIETPSTAGGQAE